MKGRLDGDMIINFPSRGHLMLLFILTDLMCPAITAKGTIIVSFPLFSCRKQNTRYGLNVLNLTDWDSSSSFHMREAQKPSSYVCRAPCTMDATPRPALTRTQWWSVRNKVGMPLAAIHGLP